MPTTISVPVAFLLVLCVVRGALECLFDLCRSICWLWEKLPSASTIKSVKARRLALLFYVPIFLPVSLASLPYVFWEHRKEGVKANVHDLLNAYRRLFTKDLPKLWSKDFRPES